MPTHTFHIPNISCGHCTRSIENELNELKGIEKVESDIGKKTVHVQWEAPATLERIEAALRDINYPPDQSHQ
jgi:copper chaperone